MQYNSRVEELNGSIGLNDDRQGGGAEAEAFNVDICKYHWVRLHSAMARWPDSEVAELNLTI